MIEKLFSKHILDILPDINNLSEIRLRANQPLIYSKLNNYFKTNYNVSNEDIEYVIKKATNNSFYAHEDTIKNGYISYFGIRIGLAGEGVLVNDNIVTLKNINSLCVRIPKEIFNCEEKLKFLCDNFDNTLIISKPGFGKTTLLRDIIKRLSKKLYNILVLDEKGEISFNNSISLNEGADVIINIPKIYAYKHFIRVLRPDIVATDEVFGEDEILSIQDILRCGVKTIVTLHANSYSSINHKLYAKLISFMRYVIVLEDVGKISKIYDRAL